MFFCKSKTVKMRAEFNSLVFSHRHGISMIRKAIQLRWIGMIGFEACSVIYTYESKPPRQAIRLRRIAGDVPVLLLGFTYLQ